jgi:hypothetical protein
MVSTDVKSEVEKSSVERKSFEVTVDQDVSRDDEFSPEDLEFLESFGEAQRKAVIRKVRCTRLVLQTISNKSRIRWTCGLSQF